MLKKMLFLLLHLILIFTLINFFSSCFSSNHNRRGSLSDAMDKASDDNEDRQVDTEPDHEPEIYYEEDNEDEYLYQSFKNDSSNLHDKYSDDQNSYPEIIEDDMESIPAWLSIQGGTGILKGKDYFGLNHFNLSLAANPVSHQRLALNAGFAWAPLQNTSVLKQSLDGGVILLNLGFNYNYYTTHEHTFLGQYFTFGFKYNYMIWSYKNPILADYYDDWGNYDGTEEISNDGLSGFEFYSGVGFHILQVKGFQVGGEVSPGVIFWVWETTEGFENDVFSTFWYIKFKVLVNLKFN
jgi:hypothetical protein